MCAVSWCTVGDRLQFYLGNKCGETSISECRYWCISFLVLCLLVFSLWGYVYPGANNQSDIYLFIFWNTEVGLFSIIYARGKILLVVGHSLLDQTTCDYLPGTLNLQERNSECTLASRPQRPSDAYNIYSNPNSRKREREREYDCYVLPTF